MKRLSIAAACAAVTLLGLSEVQASQRASFYHESQRIACGGSRFNPSGLTAAHRTLPCGTRVRVTNLGNGRSVVVTINDRGPAKWTGKSIDLSRGAAAVIGMISAGVARVNVEVL